MASANDALPEGFVLDNTQAQTPDALPDGFQLDTPTDPTNGLAASMGVTDNVAASTQDPDLGAASRAMNAAGGGFAQGVPVVGPYLDDLLNKGEAGVKSVMKGMSFQDALAQVQGKEQADQAEFPGQTTAGQVAGGVAGVAALPLSVETLPAAMAVGGGIAGADSASRQYHDTGSVGALKTAIDTGVGMVTGAAGHFLGALFQRPRLDASTENNVNALNREGISVTKGQALNDPKQLAREGQAHGALDAQRAQQNRFSQVAGQRAGIEVGEDGTITGEAIDQAFDGVGRSMDHMADTYPVNDQNLLLGAFRTARQAINQHFHEVNPQAQQVLSTIGRRMFDNFRRGSMSGRDYQDIQSNLSWLRKNPDTARVATQVQDALSDAMETNLGNVNPNAQGWWRTHNQQYKDLLVLRNAVTRGSDEDVVGRQLITPQNLWGAVKKIYGERRVATQTAGTLEEWARAGSVLKPLPTGAGMTADQANNMWMGRAAATTLGVTLGGPWGAAAGVVPDLARMGYNASNLALRPTNSPFTSAIASQVGGKAGAFAGTQFNPFVRGLGQ